MLLAEEGQAMSSKQADLLASVINDAGLTGVQAPSTVQTPPLVDPEEDLSAPRPTLARQEGNYIRMV